MLEQEIGKLAVAIRNAVTQHKDTHSIKLRHVVSVRRRDFTLKYQENIGFADFEPTRLERDIWDWDDQDRFHRTAVESSEEFRSLVSAVEGPKVGSILAFSRSICFASFDGIDDRELAERVGLFGRELADQSLPVKVTAFINGLSISDSPLVMSDHFVLRGPTPEDVSEHVPVDEFGSFSFPLPETWFRVVADFKSDAVYTGQTQMEFLRTIEALRLFRVGGVEASRYRMKSSHSFLHGSITTASGSSNHCRYAYTLSSSDAVNLSAFLRDIVPRLSNPLNLDNATTEREIAYARYKDALFQGGPSERSITSAITALEALFLTNEPELKHRLAQRVSVFLRVLGTQVDAQRTYQIVSKGYNIRSTFIHGGSVKAKYRPQADSLAPVLLEYARECVLSFIQIETPKDEVLAQLDRTMIDSTSVSKLEDLLKPALHK